MPLTLGSSDVGMQDGREDITFVSVLGSGNTSVSVAVAIGMGPTRREVAADGGFFFQVQQEWWVPKSALGSVVPKQGDYLVDAGGTTWALPDDVETSGRGLGDDGVMYRLVTKQGRP